MRLRHQSLLAIAVVPLVSTMLAAQQPPPQDTVMADTARRSVQLRAVTITAAPADRRGASTATHVSQAQIQQTPASSPWDLLRQTAGVEVHLQGQGPGFASDASVRGFSSDHSTDLALWIDEVPINEPVNGHAEGYNDWSLIFPAGVRDVDVIKGPTSALFGNFSLSGTVNVRTLERMTGTQADVSGGNFGHGEASFMIGFDHGSAGGGVFGFRGSHEGGFRPNSKNDLGQGHARIVHDLTSGVTLDAGVELYGASWDSPGYLSEQEFADKQYDIISNPTDGGICCWKTGISFLIASATSTVLLPGCRWIARTMARRTASGDSNQLALLSSSTLSITLPSSSRRTGEPPRSTTIIFRKSAAVVSWPSVRSVSDRSGPYIVPVGIFTFQLRSAVSTSLIPICFAASFWGSKWTRTAYFCAPCTCT